MRRIFTTTVLFTGLSLAGFSAYAADDACTAVASEKKLAGAAKNSFMKKCQKDTAEKTCNASAAEKKLAGAAKNAHIKKCLKDATAS